MFITYISWLLFLYAFADISSAASEEQSKWPYTLHTANPRPSNPTAKAYPSAVHDIDLTLP